MKIKVSNVFAKFMNETFKEFGLPYEAKVQKFSERGYSLNVQAMPDVWELEQNGDYDYDKDEYRAIKVLYPDGYYACPKYITTKELTKEFRRTDRTESGLKQMIKNMCEI